MGSLLRSSGCIFSGFISRSRPTWPCLRFLAGILVPRRSLRSPQQGPQGHSRRDPRGARLRPAHELLGAPSPRVLHRASRGVLHELALRRSSCRTFSPGSSRAPWRAFSLRLLAGPLVRLSRRARNKFSVSSPWAHGLSASPSSWLAPLRSSGRILTGSLGCSSRSSSSSAPAARLLAGFLAGSAACSASGLLDAPRRHSRRVHCGLP